MIDGCTIQGNGSTDEWGGTGGITIYRSWPTIRDCLITGNRSHVGGISVERGFPTIERCTTTANEGFASDAGGLYVSQSSAVDLAHSILWGNCTSSGAPEANLADADVTLTIDCCDVLLAGIGGPGTLTLVSDVLDVDPLFCQPLECELAPVAGGMYTVWDSSPVLGQACGPMGALGSGCWVSLEPLSWGAIKGRYR